jgi:hypothetical protein
MTVDAPPEKAVSLASDDEGREGGERRALVFV